MKQFDMCGLGSALVDVLVEVRDEDLACFKLEKGTMRLVDSPTQAALFEALGSGQKSLVSGGSLANSLIAFVKLGGRGSLLCTLAHDPYGEFFSQECRELGIELGQPFVEESPTGTCLSLITPDAERTMRTNLGVAALFAKQHVSEELISSSRWLFLEGYLLANPHGPEAVLHALALGKKHGTKIAFTLSAEFLVSAFSGPIAEIISKSDLIFANEKEVCALTGEADYRKAFASLCNRAPGVAVTAGPDGALLQWQGEKASVSAYPCRPIDLTGAGDMFAGTFLYAINRELPLPEAGRAACYTSSLIIQQYGARFKGDLRGSLQSQLRNYSLGG